MMNNIHDSIDLVGLYQGGIILPADNTPPCARLHHRIQRSQHPIQSTTSLESLLSQLDAP